MLSQGKAAPQSVSVLQSRGKVCLPLGLHSLWSSKGRRSCWPLCQLTGKCRHPLQHHKDLTAVLSGAVLFVSVGLDASKHLSPEQEGGITQPATMVQPPDRTGDFSWLAPCFTRDQTVGLLPWRKGNSVGLKTVSSEHRHHCKTLPWFNSSTSLRASMAS